MPVLRRIYGEVDDSTFFAFRDRAKSDPSLKDIDERDRVAAAFSALATGYARGYVLSKPKKVVLHHKREGAAYLDAQREGT